MMNKICVRWKEDFPEEEYDWIYVPGTYTKLPEEKAYQVMIKGHALQFDPETREESDPILDEYFPGRDKLFEAGLYTKDHVKNNLNNLLEVDGIGPKTYNEIKDRFGAERVMDIHKKAKQEAE